MFSVSRQNVVGGADVLRMRALRDTEVKGFDEIVVGRDVLQSVEGGGAALEQAVLGKMRLPDAVSAPNARILPGTACACGLDGSLCWPVIVRYSER